MVKRACMRWYELTMIRFQLFYYQTFFKMLSILWFISLIFLSQLETFLITWSLLCYNNPRVWRATSDIIPATHHEICKMVTNRQIHNLETSPTTHHCNCEQLWSNLDPNAIRNYRPLNSYFSSDFKVDNVLSELVDLVCGVSQGSILSPLKFCLYMILYTVLSYLCEWYANIPPRKTCKLYRSNKQNWCM